MERIRVPKTETWAYQIQAATSGFGVGEVFLTGDLGVPYGNTVAHLDNMACVERTGETGERRAIEWKKTKDPRANEEGIERLVTREISIPEECQGVGSGSGWCHFATSGTGGCAIKRTAIELANRIREQRQSQE